MSIEEYRCFARVVEDDGFTAAAKTLGVSKSYVSKQVSRLEDRLAVQLLNRTTRKMTLTSEGAQFYQRVREILLQINDAEAELSLAQDDPQGVLRVSMPMVFGVRYLSPLIPAFMEAFPNVSLECDYSDHKVDLMGSSVDLALRIGQLEDSSLIARKLAPVRSYAVAAPTYIARRGLPANPAELAEHEVLLYSQHGNGHTQTWTFSAAVGGEVSVRVNGALLANVGDALVDAAVAGLGVATLPDFIVSQHLTEGRLQRVLPEWTTFDGALWAVFPHNRHVSAPVRAFVDFMRDNLEPTWVIEQ